MKQVLKLRDDVAVSVSDEGGVLRIHVDTELTTERTVISYNGATLHDDEDRAELAGLDYKIMKDGRVFGFAEDRFGAEVQADSIQGSYPGAKVRIERVTR